jgi:hypothetical protein
VQQFNAGVSNARQAVSTLIQNSINSIQQAVGAANATSAQAQVQVQNCVAQANQNLSGLQSNTSK